MPATVVLAELHDLLQVAVAGPTRTATSSSPGTSANGIPDTDAFEEEQDETGVPLWALPARFTHVYDFGDDWHHEVEVIGVGGDPRGR